MRILYTFFAVLLFSCSSETSEIKQEPSKAQSESATTKPCDPKAEKNYKGAIQSNVQLGDFRGGTELNQEALKSKGFDFSTVDGETDVIQHVFAPDMRQIMIIRASKKDNIIREITLITRDYLTEKCIGVGSTIQDFVDAHTEYQIGYDAGNDSFYLSSPDLMGIKFNILTTTFTGSMNEVSPKKKYTRDQFDNSTKIVNVSLSDF